MQLWCIWPKADVHQEEKTLLWNIHKFSSLFPFKAPLKWIMREDNLSKAFKRVFNLKQHCCWPHYYKTRATMGTEPIKTRLISLMHLTLTQCFKINTKVTSKLWKIMRLFRMVFVHWCLSAVALKIDFIWKFRVTMVTLLENRKKCHAPFVNIKRYWNFLKVLFDRADWHEKFSFKLRHLLFFSHCMTKRCKCNCEVNIQRKTGPGA